MEAKKRILLCEDEESLGMLLREYLQAKGYDAELYLDGDRVVSGVTKIDCSRPVKLELRHNSKSTLYTLRVKCFTGLPVVYINTENNTPITSKDDYLKGTIKIVEDVVTRGSGDVFESEMKIKGRGNSTWTLPKKPYKIKLFINRINHCNI